MVSCLTYRLHIISEHIILDAVDDSGHLGWCLMLTTRVIVDETHSTTGRPGVCFPIMPIDHVFPIEPERPHTHTS